MTEMKYCRISLLNFLEIMIEMTDILIASIACFPLYSSRCTTSISAQLFIYGMAT